MFKAGITAQKEESRSLSPDSPPGAPARPPPSSWRARPLARDTTPLSRWRAPAGPWTSLACSRQGTASARTRLLVARRGRGGPRAGSETDLAERARRGARARTAAAGCAGTALTPLGRPPVPSGQIPIREAYSRLLRGAWASSGSKSRIPATSEAEQRGGGAALPLTPGGRVCARAGQPWSPWVLIWIRQAAAEGRDG